MSEALDRGASELREACGPELALRRPLPPALPSSALPSSALAAPSLRAAFASARSVLLVRLRSLGDAVLMTPVPAALRAWRPEMRVAVLVEEGPDVIFRRHPAVDEVIVAPRRPSLVARLRSIARVRARRFDAVLNMHSGPTAGLYTACSGAGVRVAYARARFARACNVTVPGAPVFWDRERAHTVRHQLSPLVHLGVPLPGALDLVLSSDPAARARVEGDMRALGLRAGGFTVLQPFSGWPTKEWAPERFGQVARRLRERYGTPALVLPAADESAKLGRLLAAEPGLVRLPGRSLEDLLAWIERCGLFVGNDSGPAHVAAAFKRKCLVISGSADPDVWRPWQAPHEVLSAGLPCIPCPGDRCREFDRPLCLERISVDAALEAVERLRPFGP
jgi:ADP-heptose:LPS heptosyltransferase